MQEKVRGKNEHEECTTGWTKLVCVRVQLRVNITGVVSVHMAFQWKVVLA